MLEGERHRVTALSKSPDGCHLAVGYENGAVKVFDVTTRECAVTFSGHKSAVSSLHYDAHGMRLVSGGLVNILKSSDLCLHFYTIQLTEFD